MIVSRKIMRSVRAAVKSEMTLSQESRDTILAFFLKWLAGQSRKNEGEDGWSEDTVKMLTKDLTYLSEDIYLTTKKDEVNVDCKPRSYNMLAMLKSGTRLLDPIDKLPEVLVSVVSEQ